MALDSDHHRRVIAQYSEESGAKFYKCVMGDGGADIHYGIYEDASTTMREATKASTLRLLELAERELAKQGSSGEPFQSIVDLGAGAGGAAHLISSIRNVRVTCIELCEHHNRQNQLQALVQGIKDRIDTHTLSFDQLPQAWNSRFDLVWSQEAICHAPNKKAIFSEAFRILRNGGVFAFSDIMLAENVPPEHAKAFTDVNAVAQLATVPEYLQYLHDTEFTEIEFVDWTPHLVANFESMRRQIQNAYDCLVKEGVPAEYLDSFASSLDQRLAWPSGHVMRWGAFCCSKPHG